MSAPQFWMSALATTIPVPCGAFMPVFVIGKTLHPVWTEWGEGATSQPKLGTYGYLQISASLAASGREGARLSWVLGEPCAHSQPLSACRGSLWAPGGGEYGSLVP